MENEEFVFSLVASEEGHIFDGMTKEQIAVVKVAVMVMCGDAWLLYEKEDGWHIAVKRMDNLEKTLWTKIRIAGKTDGEPLSLKHLHIDYEETDFDEKTKFELLYYTEKNRRLLLEIFLGKFAPKDSVEYEDYERWVIKR